MVTAHICENKSYILCILKLYDIEEQNTEFCFMKIEFNTIDNAYLNISPFKYDASILGCVWGIWGHVYFAYLGGGVSLIGFYLTLTLPISFPSLPWLFSFSFISSNNLLIWLVMVSFVDISETKYDHWNVIKLNYNAIKCMGN